MIQMAPVMFEPVLFKGGLDQITPTLNLPPGVCRDALNHEALESAGYGRILGYERYNGKAKPSDASYGLLYVASYTNTPSVGQTITNGTATGVLVKVESGYMVYTKGSGTFTVGDALTVGATPIGTMIAPTSSVTSEQSAEYTNLAADSYRADIAAPTGSGAIRGVFVFNDSVYCVRDNAGATASNLWKATVSGWSMVTLFNEISFTAGTAPTPVDGETLTQGGVTATVKRVVTQTGAWTGTAAGRFIITNPAGGNFAAGAATLSGGATVNLTAVQTAITLSPGGKGVAAQANFFGQASQARIYYADGVNRCWEFDGTTLVPITTGINPDRPKYIAVHKKYLFVAVNSSIFYSDLGNPYKWTAIGGAGEIACGDTVTGFIVLPGAQTSAALAVLCRNFTNILYGTSASDWNLVAYNAGTGALDYTVQNMAQSCMLDDRGVFTLQTSLNFGNFEQNSLTYKIRQFIADHRTAVSTSGLNRLKSQYRVFYSDGWGLYITLVNNKFIGAMPVKFSTGANVTWESTLTSGYNIILMGGNDGMVYEMDRGTSFDGDAIEAYITLNWASVKNPRILKRFRHAAVEVSGETFARISFAYSLGYGSSEYVQPDTTTYDVPFQSVNWDDFTWDAFTWDGQTLYPTEVDMAGTAENVQITLASNSDQYGAYVLNSAILHYTPRRGKRS